jgi:hypothetical protein
MARVDDVQLVLDGIGDTLAIIDFPYAEFGVYVIDMDEPPIVQFYSTFQSKGVVRAQSTVDGQRFRELCSDHRQHLETRHASALPFA